MLHAIVFVIVATVMFVALYLVIHKYAPSWGTVISNSITAIAVAFQGLMGFLGMADQLPWNSILSAENSAKVLFSLAVANILMRLNGPKQAVGTAPATPPAA